MSYKPGQGKKGYFTDARSRKKKVKGKIWFVTAFVFVSLVAYIAYAMQLPTPEVFTEVSRQTPMPLDELALAGGDAPDLSRMPDSQLLKEKMAAETASLPEQFDLIWTGATEQVYQRAQTNDLEATNAVAMLDFVHADIEQVLQNELVQNPTFMIENSTWNLKITGSKTEAQNSIHFVKIQNDEQIAAYDIIFAPENHMYMEVTNYDGLYKGTYHMVFAQDNMLLCSRVKVSDENVDLNPFATGAPERYADFITPEDIVFSSEQGKEEIAVIKAQTATYSDASASDNSL